MSLYNLVLSFFKDACFCIVYALKPSYRFVSLPNTPHHNIDIEKHFTNLYKIHKKNKTKQQTRSSFVKLL